MPTAPQLVRVREAGNLNSGLLAMKLTASSLPSRPRKQRGFVCLVAGLLNSIHTVLQKPEG